MQPFKFLLVCALLLIGTYFGYLWYRSSTIPPSIGLGNYEEIKKLPPAICHFSWRNDDNSIVGDMYVLNGLTRFDYTITVLGKQTMVHMIVNQEDQAAAWNDRDTQGLKASYEKLAAQSGLSFVPLAICKVWWVPDFSLHIIPQDVTFYPAP